MMSWIVNQICYRGYCYYLYYHYYYYWHCNCIFIIVTIAPVGFVAVRQIPKENLSIVHRLSIDWSVAIILYLYLVIITSPVSTTRVANGDTISRFTQFNSRLFILSVFRNEAFFTDFYFVFERRECNVINLLYWESPVLTCNWLIAITRSTDLFLDFKVNYNA